MKILKKNNMNNNLNENKNIKSNNKKKNNTITPKNKNINNIITNNNEEELILSSVINSSNKKESLITLSKSDKILDSNSDSIPDEKNEAYKNKKLMSENKKSYINIQENSINSNEIVKDEKKTNDKNLDNNILLIQRAYRNHLSKKGFFGEFDIRKMSIVFLLKSMINYNIKPYIFNLLKNKFYVKSDDDSEKSTDTLPDNYAEVNKERIKNMTQIFNHAANIINYKEKLSSIIDEEEKNSSILNN